MTQEYSPDRFIGRPVAELITPTLVVDSEALDRNLRLLSEYFGSRPCKLRPHFKSHKCVTLARRQIAAGNCTGITCAKLSEAEQLVAGGIDDVLIDNQVVGREKARRLAELNQSATVSAAVDSPENVAQLDAAAREAGVTIGVLVEVDIGMKRCGVPPGELTPELAYVVAQAEGLRLRGLQGYEGHLVTKGTFEERRQLTLDAMRPLIEMRHALLSCGLSCPVISGGGTGTYDITGNIPGMGEVQAGSYALMDSHYRKVRPEFHVARCVLATIISSHGAHAVADVGTKGLGGEFGLPQVEGLEGATVLKVAEEHTVIEGATCRVGDKIRLIPSHGCTTNNLYRRMWVARNGIVEAMWPIEAAGCLE
jgi:D-serine deaminase-like pyridoxal phosphate-dependent protein